MFLLIRVSGWGAKVRLELLKWTFPLFLIIKNLKTYVTMPQHCFFCVFLNDSQYDGSGNIWNLKMFKKRRYTKGTGLVMAREATKR